MLVLTRNMGESFFVGDSEVVIIGVNGFQTKIGITAPKDVTILREELYYKENPDKKPNGWDDLQALKQARKNKNRAKNNQQALDNKGNR